jgi:cytochrome c biogenesis protein
MVPGRTVELPDGLGSVTFDGWQRWVKVQVSNSPGKGVALTGVVLALVGLMGSLFVRRRRAWVRVTPRGTGSYVEVAGLDRSTVAEGLDGEVRSLAAAMGSGTTPDTGREPTEVQG